MNRLTLKQTKQHLRRLGYVGSYIVLRQRVRDIRRGLLPEQPLLLSRKDACRLFCQFPILNIKTFFNRFFHHYHL